MSIIYYVISSRNGLFTRFIEEGSFDIVYDIVMYLSNDHCISSSASSWCELACVGETFEDPVFTIQIIELKKYEL